MTTPPADDRGQCYLDPTCEFGLHAPSEHPCGQRTEKPGEPCRHCGDPVPGPEVNRGACPRCWAPITVADAKALFAPYGLSVDFAKDNDHE